MKQKTNKHLDVVYGIESKTIEKLTDPQLNRVKKLIQMSTTEKFREISVVDHEDKEYMTVSVKGLETTTLTQLDAEKFSDLELKGIQFWDDCSDTLGCIRLADNELNTRFIVFFEERGDKK